MFFYHFNMLDSFIEHNFIDNLKMEQKNLNKIMDLYLTKKSNFLTEISNKIKKQKLDAQSLLKNFFEDLAHIQLLIRKLTEMIQATISLYDKGLEDNHEEIKANLVEYNKQRDELSRQILNFETSTTLVLNSIFTLKKIKKQILPTQNEKTVDIELEPYDHNILIVSEKDQKAYLPFYYSTIKKIYQNKSKNYQTLQDIINENYVVPLSRFKNSTIARFKESFNLIRKKEKGSIKKALDLGLELMFQYNLNPIIIAACRNLDELDIYLDCLAENELHDFPCFEIKFEITPV